MDASAKRDFDVVLYGATGFTGRQTVAYFAAHAPGTLRWAIAGRDRQKLERVRGGTVARLRAEDVLVADSGDQPAIDAIVRRTRVLLTTAGPFARYGTPLVDACVRFGTHYVDITGETLWLRELIARYHDRAAAEGTRLIPCCGFDSVPSDLGAMLVARQVHASFGVPCVEVRAAFRLRGGLNGGTAATALDMAIAPGRSGLADPFLLNPLTGSAPSARQIARSADLRAPHYDTELGAWVGPFVMAGINTRVVRRSAALFAEWQEPYGPDFVYQECAKYTGPLARAKATAFTAGLGLFNAALRRPLTRRLVAAALPKPGKGPSVAAMDGGSFVCELVGFAADGRRVRGLIRHKGDPGNRATVRMVCESALALASAGDALNGGRGGILTPATGLGSVLVDRLRSAGVRIETTVG